MCIISDQLDRVGDQAVAHLGNSDSTLLPPLSPVFFQGCYMALNYGPPLSLVESKPQVNQRTLEGYPVGVSASSSILPMTNEEIYY